MPDNDKSDELKIKKGTWSGGKRQEWREDITPAETEQMKQRYNEIRMRMYGLATEIEFIEQTIKQLVVQ